jgi:archaellum component FlaF (FlaF/FlaG flagellin family)
LKIFTRNIFLILVILIFVILIVGCKVGQSGAAQAIEAYIKALSNRDSVQISNLSCTDWEQSAMLEVDSLTAVGSKVVDLSCMQIGQTGEDTYVSCTGMLSLDYNGEAQQIDLSTHTYIARQEDGQWRMCGYH